MTDPETDRLIFTLLVFFIGFIGGVLVGHGKEEEEVHKKKGKNKCII